MPELLYKGKVASSTANDATLINYDNEDSGLEATNVQGAVDELNENLAKLSNYEISEVKIGKFGNKDLYRRTIKYNGSISNGQLVVIDSTIKSSDIDNLISIKGGYYDGTAFWALPYSEGSSYGVSSAIDTTRGVILRNFTGLTISNIVGVYEYTKA